MKTRLIITISCLLALLNVSAQQNSQETDGFNIEKYINRFEESKIIPNNAGWSYWYFPSGVADTLSVKTSRVFLQGSSHTPHAHNQDEAFYTVQGPVTIHVNGEERTLQTGDFFYYPSRSSHAVYRAGDGPIQYFIINREQPGGVKPFKVSKENYTIDDLIYQPTLDPKWTNGNGFTQVVAVDEKFSGGLRFTMTRVTKTDKEFQNRPPYKSEQEMFFIIRGEADVTLNGHKSKLGPNTAFWCPQGFLHSIKQTGEEPLIFLTAITYPR